MTTRRAGTASARGAPARAARAAALSATLSSALACSAPELPEEPVLAAPTSPTAVPEALLLGAKQASTSVSVNGDEVVPLDEETTFAARVPLREGPNTLVVVAQDALGRGSPAARVSVVLDTRPPPRPLLDAALETTTEDAELRLIGTRENGASVWLNGEEVVQARSGTRFSVGLPLVLGDNPFRLVARDAAGNEGEVLEGAVVRVPPAEAP